MLDALPLILFCSAFVVVGYFRTRWTAAPLPSLNALGLRVLRIQVLGFVAAVAVAFFADREVAVVATSRR
jgi:hypothetical protein